MPMIALSGVRISWLTTEMKRRFAWFAASARARASISLVTSERTYMDSATMPIISPMPLSMWRCQNALPARTAPKPARLTASANIR
jgi:hypothetical protein